MEPEGITPKMTIKYHKYDLSQLKNLHVLFRTAKSPCFFWGGAMEIVVTNISRTHENEGTTS